MAPARKIAALRCSDSFDTAARQILAVRLDELADLRVAITGPEDSGQLHDLRIAAKRLRYSLETFAVCFPDKEAQSYADRVRDMQDILGRIHDLDVLQGLLLDRIATMDREGRKRGLEIATCADHQSHRLEELRNLVGEGDRGARLGLYQVIASKADERRTQYARFESLWTEWEESGVLNGISAMLGRRATTVAQS
jgi:hypothetical protein